MSTRVIAAARLNATCRDELREQLRLSVDPASELSRLNSVIVSGPLTRPDLEQLISTPSASSVLRALAPAEFSRFRAHMKGGSRSAVETTAADLQAELAETLEIAISVVTAAVQAIIANIFAQSAAELGYTVTTHHAETATCVELRRRHEIVLIAVRGDGVVEFSHGELTDDTSGEHQLQLERAAGRHGIFVAQHP